LNVAVTLFAASVKTTQASVPVQAPVHPANVEPLTGVTVRVTGVPLLKDALQVVPQSIPAGLLDTVPVPAPDFDTVRLNVSSTNVAETDFAASIVTTHVPVVFVQAPLQPANTDPALGAAVSVTVTSEA
jgi:hypothetical protein